MQGINSLYHLRDAWMRLTLVRECLQSDVFMALSQLLDEIEHSDNPDSLVWAYHEFASSVLSLDDAPVTGDRWKDHLLAVALETDTVFARGAARGVRDEVLMRAEMRDLSALEQLYSITDEKIIQWIDERQRIDARSWIRWSMPGHTPDFGKGPLAEARRLLTESEDWSICAEKLWNFYHAYGAGMLLSSNNFWLEDRLYALQRIDPGIASLEEVWPEYAQIKGSVGAILEGAPAQHVLIAAEDGQRFAAQSLLSIGDNVRLIELGADAFGSWAARLGLALQQIDDMPGVNLVFIDLRGQEIEALAQLPKAMGNTIIIAAVSGDGLQEENPLPGFLQTRLAELPESTFTHYVERLVRQTGRDVSHEYMQSVLQKYSGHRYSIEEADRVAREIIKASGKA